MSPPMSEPQPSDPSMLAPAPRSGTTNSNHAELEALVNTVRVKDLLVTLRRHLRLVLGVAGAVLLVTGYLAYRSEPVYRAVAVIRSSDSRRALTGGLVEGPSLTLGGASVDPLLSQMELLTSRTVAGEVVDSTPMLRIATRKFPASLLRDVGVAATAEPDSFLLTFGRDSLTVVRAEVERSVAYGVPVTFGDVRFAVTQWPGVRQGLLRVTSRDAAISRLILTVRVTPRTRTDIVDVAYSAPDPVRARQVVNRVVDVFRTTSAEAAQQQSKLRREFLEAQLKVNDAVLAEARQALSDFHRRARAYGSAESVTREQTGVPALELEREQLDAERRTYGSLLASLRDSITGRKALQSAFAAPGVAASPTVAQLGTQLHQYEMARDSLASRSGSHPDLPRLTLLIASTEGKLLRAVQAGVQSSLVSLDSRIAALDDLRARLTGSLRQLSATEAEEARLTERVEIARKIADDLRRGALHRVLALPRRPGLTDCLAGDATPEQVLQTTSYPCLDFLASGSRRRDAPELMGSPEMIELMTRLRAQYEVIVIDTPPLGAGVDAFALAMLAGNLMMVLRLGRTDRDLAEAKLDILRRLPVRLLGAVLNDVREGSDYGAYGYYVDGYEHTNEPLFEPL